MTAEFTIRSERESDHDLVYAIQEEAFGQPAEAGLVGELRRSAEPQLSLVAESGGRPVGHIFLSPVSVEGDAPDVACAGLAPVGVLPALQGRGIGGALVRESLARCPALGWSAVFLLGAPAYYSRFGFVLAAPLGFHYESEFFDSAFQVRECVEGVLEGSSGWVRYHEAFANL